MININCLYNGRIDLELLLDQHHFDMNSECLVRIYTAICTCDEAVAIAKEIKLVLPNSSIFGASGSGVIFNAVQHDAETLIVIEKMEHTKSQIHTFSYEGKSAQVVAHEVGEHLKEATDTSLMHIVCGGIYSDVHDFVKTFNKKYCNVKLIGGIAGDILSKNISGYVFTEEGVIPNGIITATYRNKELHVFHRVNISHETISPTYSLDKCNGSLIEEIEGRPAEEWCKEQLGMKTLSSYDDWQTIAENDALVRFPLVLEGEGGASRFIKYDPVSEKVSLYFSKLPNHTSFRIGYVSPIKCVKESYSVCNELEQHPVESLFCYTCLFRKLYLQNCAEWELNPFSEIGVCGVFMMGEIANIEGKNRFLNGSCCLTGIAEEQEYVHPNYSVFTNLYQIKDDNESLLHFVLKKQSEEMTRENQHLLEQLMEQQTVMQNQLYTDMTTGLPNSIKFLKDNQNACFNKLCLIAVDNAELMMSRTGKEMYYKFFKMMCEDMLIHCRKRLGCADINLYIQSETRLFIVSNDKVSENAFMDIVHTLYREFQIQKFEAKKEIFVNRFVLVLNQNELLEKAFNTLKSCSSLQTDFLVWDSTLESGEVQEEELNMIYVLNRAIEENRIIPYFQGIHDNETKTITKYEALMRVVDHLGRVYSPIEFMDIAKKYHLYSKISSIMIEKVMRLFMGRKESVSINLSVYDFSLSATFDKILKLLDKVGDASNFIFEILEDEKFRDLEMLRQFIDQSRRYGVKIAIDDFGSGYSNFMEIAKIEPDYIKIDGSIIKDIVGNLLHQKVSENIVFLGSQLNADLVAEYVENEQIQEKVEEVNIRFSQGYYFAKPVPFEELKLLPRA